MLKKKADKMTKQQFISNLDIPIIVWDGGYNFVHKIKHLLVAFTGFHILLPLKITANTQLSLKCQLPWK